MVKFDITKRAMQGKEWVGDFLIRACVIMGLAYGARLLWQSIGYKPVVYAINITIIVCWIMMALQMAMLTFLTLQINKKQK